MLLELLVERGKGFSFMFRTILIVGRVIENLAEVLEPPCIDHGAVSEDKCTPELHQFYHLKGGQSLAETHLGVPKHLIALFELLESLLDGFLLFGSEDNRRTVFGYLARTERLAPLFKGRNSGFGGFEVAIKPLVGIVFGIENFALYAGTDKQVVNVFVVERADTAISEMGGNFGIKQLIFYTGCLRLMIYALTGGCIQLLAVGLKCKIIVRGIARSLANFQDASVRLIVDTIDVYQLRF